MEISYLGHSSFKIKTKGATVVTDPYDPAMVGKPFARISADIVTISHDHADHNKSDLVKNTRKIINGPGEYEILGVSIVGFPCFHDDKSGELRGKNTIYLFEAEEMRLLHLGDLGHILKEEDVQKLGEIDILMIPVGGEFTIDAGLAVDVINSIEPKIVIPMHYNRQGLNQEVFGQLGELDTFLKALSWTSEQSEKLILKGILGEEHKVVVLKPLNG